MTIWCIRISAKYQVNNKYKKNERCNIEIRPLSRGHHNTQKLENEKRTKKKMKKNRKKITNNHTINENYNKSKKKCKTKKHQF